MKRYILGTIFSIICQAVLYGQNVDIENDANVRTQIETIFDHLDKSRVPTGLLRDYSTDLVDYSIYDGTMNDSNIASLTKYEYILRSIRSSSVTSNYPFGSVTGIMNDMREATTATTVPISIAAFKYNYVVDDAISSGALRRVGDQVYDCYDNSNNWINPYRESYVVAFSPSVEMFPAGSYTFTVGDFTYSNLDIASVELDAGDGRGYRRMAPSVTADLSGGNITLKLKITLTDGTVLFAHSEVMSEISYNYPLDVPVQNLPDLVDSFFVQTSSGTRISASASIKYAPGNTSLVKPFIIVEGFDPWELDDSMEENNPYYGKGYTTLEDLLIQRDSLTSICDSCDIVYVDWNDSWARIQDNAELLIKIINWVNEHKVGDEKNVLMGQSMGGLVARYALCKMENERVPHRVTTFVSHDVPYLGANVPIGHQHAFADIMYSSVFSSAINLAVADSLKDKIRYAKMYYNSPSARQMLIHHVGTDGTVDDSEHLKWQKTLKDIGFPKGDYNLSIQNIAISNGGVNNQQADTLLNVEGHCKIAGWARFLAGLALPRYPLGTLLFDSFASKVNVKAKFNTYPFVAPGSKVYEASIKYNKKIKWLGISRTYTLYSKTKYAPSSVGVDNSNGSFYVLPSDITKTLKEYQEEYNELDSVSVVDRFIIVPTASALCIGSDSRGLTQADYHGVFSKEDYSKTPFSYIYVGDEADVHIAINKSIADSTAGRLKIKFGGPILPKENDRYYINNYTGDIEWSTSDSNIATIDDYGRIHIKKTGFVTVYARCEDGSTQAMRVMTGIPEFSLSSQKKIMACGYSLKARCDVAELADFVSKTNLYGLWGVKYDAGEIDWTEDHSLIFEIGGEGMSYSTFVSNGDKNAYVYFKAVNDAFTSKTSMVVCSAVPVEKPIEGPVIVTKNGILVSEEDVDQVSTRSGAASEAVSYCIDGKVTLVFDHIPSASEFRRELAKPEGFREILKDMKPWGERERIILKVRIVSGEENYEGVLKLIYKEAI